MSSVTNSLKETVIPGEARNLLFVHVSCIWTALPSTSCSLGTVNPAPAAVRLPILAFPCIILNQLLPVCYSPTCLPIKILRLRLTRPTLNVVPPFPHPFNSVSPLFATHTTRSQITENTVALSCLFATHTDFAPVTPLFATHTKTTEVCANNSHSGTQKARS